ncbi:MAG: hypothetical protein HZB65_03040 [Candidatus Aenigmarchaeota archaeon]|nr:hypothetical protein [Candidatus Aenigmarchaeota archaeon]
MNDKLTYNDLIIPEFVYSRKVGYIGNVEIDIKDALTAVVLSGLSGIIVGHSEKGKSYYGKLLNKRYFGSKGLIVQGSGIEENTDLITQMCKKISKEDAKTIVKEDVLASPYWLVEELGAIPKQLQSMFYSVGDGILPHEGREYLLGTKLDDMQYFCLLATTNSIENGENAEYGNFGISRAAASRFHICIDMRYYGRSMDDILNIGLGSGFTDPRHSTLQERTDISEKIFGAYKEIRETARNPSLEELAAWYYISIGGANCLKETAHLKNEENWHLECMDCDKDSECMTKYFNAFGLMRSNNTIGIYANALAYLAKLKDPSAVIDAADAVFLASKFGLSGKIGIVNPVVKKQEYSGSEGQLIEDAIDKIRKDYKTNEAFILASLDKVSNGKKLTKFFEFDGKCGSFDDIDKKAQTHAIPIEPYTDNRSVGLSWFLTFIDKAITSKEHKRTKQKS